MGEPSAKTGATVTDDDLCTVIELWPSLPENSRRAVQALVGSNGTAAEATGRLNRVRCEAAG
jgi:hypothetical protein